MHVRQSCKDLSPLQLVSYYLLFLKKDRTIMHLMHLDLAGVPKA